MCTGSKEIISSKKNKFIKEIKKLEHKKYRDVTKQFLVEGEHLIEELENSSYNYQTISTEDDAEVIISQEIAKYISQTNSGSNSFALADMKKQGLDMTRDKYLVLDGIQDPGNLGTIVRTAYSFGFDFVILSEDCADYYNGKTLRSSQGACFHIDHYRGDLKEIYPQMKNKGVSILTTALSQNSRDFEDIKFEKFALVLGSEGRGVSALSLHYADEHILIPMINFESLNVAVAAGILMYHYKD